MIKEVLSGAAFSNHYAGPLIVLTIFLILALIVNLLFYRMLKILTRKTKSDLDDKIRKALRNPITLSIVLVGTYTAYVSSALFLDYGAYAVKIAKTLVVLLWFSTFSRMVGIIIDHYQNGEEEIKSKKMSKQMLPFIERISKAIILLIAFTVLLIVWEVDVSPLLASAGVLSLAVAFAAKDTVANVFGGLSIFFDKTYEIGHFIIVGEKYRGMVTDIGLRTTKILTRDDITVTIPNSEMANSAVVNESASDNGMLRVRMKLGIQYGQNIDKIEKTLMAIADGAKWVAKKPRAKLRFRMMGESALEFEFLFWVKEPKWRGRALSEMNHLVYNEFKKKKIKIGYVSDHFVEVQKK